MPAPIIQILDAPDYEAEIHRGADALIAGEIVVLPTETVYGAACLLNHSAARDRLRSLRASSDVNPFTIHLARPADALEYLGPVSDFGRRLIKKLWPGPVGLVFQVPPARRSEVASKLKCPEKEIYDGQSITLRCPDHMVTSDILSQVPGPVVLTTAGQSGNGPNLKIESLATELNGKVDLIFDAGSTRYSKPSTLLKVSDDRYEIVRTGVYDERIIERLLKTTILFVCSGNTCRSPMAEAIAKQFIAQKLQVSESELDKKGINVISAGSVAMPGSKATPAAVEALKGIGADLTRHRSRALTVELIHQADWVFAMGISHAYAARSLVPSAADKITTLDPDGDVEDPIGSDVAVYKELAGQLQTMIQRRLEEKAIV